MKTLTIEKGWFFGAGSAKMYNWKKDGYDTFGVGISLDFLKGTDETEIVVAGERYYLLTKDAIDFARTYNTQENRRGTNIIVISKSILIPIEVLPTVDL